METLSLLRIAMIGGDKALWLESLIGSYTPKSDQRIPPIDIENETKVMRQIAKMCAKAI